MRSFAVALWIPLLVTVGQAQRSFDIYGYTLLPYLPAFLCPNKTRTRRQLQDGVGALLDFKTRQTEENVSALLADDSLFSASSRVVLSEDDSTIGTVGASLRANSDEVATLARRVQQIFFTGCSDPHTCSAEESPVEPPFSGLSSIVSEGVLGSIVSVVGSSKLLLCAASRIFLNQNNPVNLGVVLCQCAAAVSSADGVCAVIKALSHAVGCAPYKDCGTSALPPLLDYSVGGLELRLSAALPTPATMSRDVIQEELVSYYWAWQALEQLVYETMEALCSPLVEPLSLPGWTVEQTGHLIDVDLDGHMQRLPLVRVQSRRNNVDGRLVDVLVTIRGTATPSEWALDFSYNKVTYMSPLFGPTDLHRGFSAVATALSSYIKSVLDSYALDGRLGTVTIAGHSLGAGIGAALAFMLANVFPLTVEGLPNAPPRFRAILFGAPLVGNEEFTRNLARIVALRTLTAEFDAIAHIPCNNLASCSAAEVPIPTGRNNGERFTFGYYAGAIEVPRSDLPPTFSAKGTNLQVAAWHTCAYPCWLTSNVTPSQLQQCLSANSSANQAAVCSYF